MNAHTNKGNVMTTATKKMVADYHICGADQRIARYHSLTPAKTVALYNRLTGNHRKSFSCKATASAMLMGAFFMAATELGA